MEWKHAIASRKSDQVGTDRIARGRRISLTFRSVKIAEELKRTSVSQINSKAD